MKKEYINTDPQIEHFILEQNGNFPNNTLPVLIYKNAIVLTQQKKQTDETLAVIIRQARVLFNRFLNVELGDGSMFIHLQNFFLG